MIHLHPIPCADLAEAPSGGIDPNQHASPGVLARHPSVAQLAVALLHRCPGDAVGDLLDALGLACAVLLPRTVEGIAEDVLGVGRQMQPNPRRQVGVGGIGTLLSPRPMRPAMASQEWSADDLTCIKHRRRPQSDSSLANCGTGEVVPCWRRKS